ncbi:MAG TPA: hypothetical protein VF432_02105 [Thermoanaerobaculia bacterium]
MTLLAAASVAAQEIPEKEPLLPSPTLTRISAEGGRAAVAARIAGSGLGIGERRSIDADGRELVWREHMRATDQRGGVHVTYKQYLVGNGVDAELFGSGMAVHYEADGDLAFVDGAQFEKVKIANSVRLSPRDASRRAVAHLRTFAHADVERDLRRAEIVDPDLKLVQWGDTFRFAYFATAADDDGAPQRVILDAENDRLLARVPMQLNSNCTATPGTLVRANGIPVRPDVNVRLAHQATLVPAGTRPAPFTHEGSWNYSGIKMTVFQATRAESPDPMAAYKCLPSETRSYTVFPVQPDVPGGVPTYRDRDSGGGRPWVGSAAGDALWNTYLTMRTFVGFGRKGWDDRNSPANIFVDDYRRPDAAAFNYVDGYNTAFETKFPNGVLIGQAIHYYSNAAALDVVAHEWGHGVVFTSAGWTSALSGTAFEERALHEGWSDVIGMIVEKRQQVNGFLPEQRSDWRLHEDAGDGDYVRGAEDDGAGHAWQTIDDTEDLRYNDKLHKNDCSGLTTNGICGGPAIVSTPPPAAFKAHDFGNMLNMVHKLLAEGGKNPACVRVDVDGDAPEVDCPTVAGLGSSKAGLILFQALQYRMRWWHFWDDLADVVKQEAFNQYNGCSFDITANAAGEQQAVMNAFANIGYPGRTSNIITCP